MPKSAHTGGEGAVWDFLTDGSVVIQGQPAGLFKIGRAQRGGRADQEFEANARLMAAAPEMLRALRLLADEKLLHAISQPTREAIDRAIASATGEG